MTILRIVADANMPGLDGLEGASVEYREGRQIEASHLQDADALLVRSVTQVNKELLDGTAVRFVGTATSGFDHIDRAYLDEAGIAFSHAPGSNANSVVEYVLAAIARIDGYLEQCLAGEKIGVVGFGNIGKLLCQRLTALGMEFCCYDPWLEQSHVTNAASLDEVLACRVITLHPSLTVTAPWPSRHLLGDEELSRIASDQLLINASRGEVIDNAALLKQLKREPEWPVVLDVWEGEPALDSDLLEQVVIGSAHIAGYSLDSKFKATAMLLSAMAQSLGLPEFGAEFSTQKQEPIKAPPTQGGVDTLRSLLCARYQIMDDDKLLRETALEAAGDSQLMAAGFDRLRKTYAVRRELIGSRITDAQPGAYSLIRALGCTPEEAH